MNKKFCYSICKLGIWYRYNTKGYSILFPNFKPMFSERNGIEKPIFKIFGFRLFRLDGY